MPRSSNNRVFARLRRRPIVIVLAAIAAFILSIVSGAASVVIHQLPRQLNPSALMPSAIERIFAHGTEPNNTPLTPMPVGSPILAWDTSGLAGNEASFSSSTTDANLNSSSLTRGSGLTAASLADSFNSNAFVVNGTVSDATSNNEFLQFTISPKPGYKVSLSTLDANFRRTSTGPNAFQWQYSLDGFATAGNNIGSAISYTATTSNGDAQTQINLSGVSGLQNILAGSTVTMRLYGYGATGSTGAFAFGRLTGNDLAIGGTVAATQTISGTLYDSVCGPSCSITPISGKTITLLQNGTSGGSTVTNGSGVYTLTGVTLANGDRIAVFIDNATEKGATVTLSGTSDIAALNIYQNVLVVRTDNGGTITNANLANAQGGTPDSDLTAVFTVASNNLTTPAGKSIQIWNSSSYQPGGNITDGGHWEDDGTFIPGTFTVTLNGTSNQTIGLYQLSVPFYNLTIDDTGTSPNNVVTLYNNISVGNVLTISHGVLDQNVTGNSSNVVTTGSASNVVVVNQGATWQNFGTGAATLSGNVSNNGTINFNANGTACGDAPNNDDILIRSSVANTQRTWAGTGTFSMTDVNVKDQKVGGSLLNPPVFILVNSGTNAGNNTGWTFVDQCTSGTYTWIGGTAGANTDWQVGTNWNPTRGTTDNGDVLLFDYNSTPAPLVTNIPSQTIAKLKFLNGAAATFNNSSVPAATAQTLTINGLTTDSVVVSTGSGITLDGSPTITLLLTFGSKADVQAGSGMTSGGQITLQGSAHRVLAGAANAISFANGANFTTQTGFTGSPFGDGSSQGTPQSVEFKSGSATFFHAGGDPFGVSATPVVTFDSGSTESFFASSAFSYSGRSYGNLVLDGNQSYDGGATSLGLNCQNNFTLADGSSLALSSLSGGDFTLQGDLTDNNASGGITPRGRTINFQGAGTLMTPITQNVKTASTLAGVLISQANGSVKLQGNLTIGGALQFNAASDLLELNAKTLTLNGTVAGAGNLKGDAAATLSIGGTGALGTLRFLSGAQTLSIFTVARGSSGSVTLGNDLLVDDDVNLTSGVVKMQSFTLTTNGNVTRSSGYIIGNEQRSFSCAGGPGCLVTSDVGTDNGYSPVQQSMTAGAGTYTQTVKAVQGQHPSIHGVSVNALQRYWTLTAPSGPSFSAANITFNYLASDVVGTPANYVFFKNSSGAWSQRAPTGMPTNTSAVTNNVSSFSDWTLAEAGAVTPGTISFVGAPYSTLEDNNIDHDVTITVNRSGGMDGAVDVSYATSDGTATLADNDYVAASGLLHWNDGESGTKNFLVRVKGDLTLEADETVNITLSSPTDGATITPPASTTLTILNDDGVFEVNSTGDGVDVNIGDGVCADSIGKCTLRAAIAETNFNSNLNQIRFNIPAATDSGCNSGTGVCTIKPASGLPTITQPVIIDGYTQPGATVNTLAVGNNANLKIEISGENAGTIQMLRLEAANSTITGLAMNKTKFAAITIVGTGANNNWIKGNYFGITVDGTTAAANNPSEAIYMCCGANHNTTGTNADGISDPAERNVFSGFSNSAIFLDNSGTSNNVIAGNYIGTNAAGTAAIPNSVAGIRIDHGASNNTIGGTTTAARNVISGNKDSGIFIQDTNTIGNVIQGNYIGLGADGTTALGNTAGTQFAGFGIYDLSSGFTIAGNVIGGPGAGAGNVIANNASDGVRRSYGFYTSIRGNSIHDNGGLGIDLNGDGVTPNDSPDHQSGIANFLQNFPVLTSAVADTTNTINGTLNSVAAQTFTIDFYSSPACDPSGFGEGQTYLGTVTTSTTDGNGDVAFTFHPASLAAGQFITATATDSNGNTSEFSACIVSATPAGLVQFSSSTYTVAENAGSISIPVTRTVGSVGAVSVHYTTVNGSAAAGSDYTTASGTLSWGNGDSATQFINVPITDNIVVDGNRNFTVTLSSSTGGVTIGIPSTTTVTISDNDVALSFSIDNVTHAEGNSGPTDFVFTVTKSGNIPVTATVHFDTVDGTATSGSGDYDSQSNTLTFLSTDTTKPITIHVNGDTTYEADEGFKVHLSGATNATISNADGIGTITNDDTPPATLVVNTTDDQDNGACLVSHCSLREAINAANFASDTNTITFGIDASSDSGCNSGTGVCTIKPAGALPAITQPVNINGYSQPLATANTLTAGDDAALKIVLDDSQANASFGLDIQGGNSSVRGLVVNQCGAGAIKISVNGGNTIAGNFIGTNVSGTALAPSGSVQIFNVANNTIGGTTPADRNLLGNSAGEKLLISGANASGNLVQGNFIGTNAAGTAALGGAVGVFIGNGAHNNTIGGSTAGARNIISGNGTSPLQISDAANANTVQGNYIGTDVTGTNALGNGWAGVWIIISSNNIIGGPNPGEGNIIANNGGSGNAFRTAGVVVDFLGGGTTPAQNSIRGNSIYNNTGLGIDIGPVGVTANDPQDTDSGANNLQNFPVITSAIGGGTYPITGTLNTTPSSSSGYVIEFFKNSTCDGSGNGQGQTYLGSVTTGNTDANGDVAFSLNSPTPFSAGDKITATATDINGNTSEFSTCFTATAAPTLTVNKTVVPSGDTGTFDLRIDGVIAGTGENQGNGGTTGPVVVTVGSHQVSELAHSPTDINDYEAVFGGDCDSSGMVSLAPGQSKVCTITNTRRPKLTVNKVLVPSNDPGKFNLTIDGGVSGTGGEVGDGGTTGPVAVIAGPHTVGESAGTSTTLSNYTTVISGNCNPDGTITLAAGDNKTCTITNTRNAPPTNLVVTKTEDSDDNDCSLADCSLREAIYAANSNPDTNKITFNIPLSDSGCNGGARPCTIMLAGTELVPNSSMNIEGPTAYGVVVDGGGSGRVFHIQAGDVNISNLTMSDGGGVTLGGGIYNEGGTLGLRSSTISSNTSAQGGGLYNASGRTATVTNVTISGNSAPSGGGGINNDGTLQVTNSTIAENSGFNHPNNARGIRNTGTLTIRNTIVTGVGKAPNCTNVGTFTSQDHNISSDPSCSFGGPGDLNGTDPMLAPLANNGGPTQTHALLGGSPAIDAGDDCVFTGACITPALPTDQRGGSFNRKFGAHVDIGAFELQASCGSTITLSPPTLSNGTNGVSYSQTITASPSGSYTFTVASGYLPPGLMLATDGTLSGTPSSNGSYDFQVLATDSNGCMGLQAYTIVISTPADVSVAVSPDAMFEDSTNPLTYTFTRSDSTGSLTVNFSASGTADGTNDYNESGTDTTFASPTGTVTFNDGELTKNVIITPVADFDYEANETVVLTITPDPAYNVVSPNSATGTITNDDSPPANSQTFTVNTTNDDDHGACVTAHCSLREAINAANANPDTNRIEFNIPADDPGHFYYQDDNTPGQLAPSSNTAPTIESDDLNIPDKDVDWPHSWWSIQPIQNLPSIINPVTIDGYTQPGAVQNTDPTCQDGVLRIELNGLNIDGGIGLEILSGPSTVKGLAINRFADPNGNIVGSSGLKISTIRGTTNDTNTITGNFIGTDISGTLAGDEDGNLFGNQIGVLIDGVANNTIGGPVTNNTNATNRNLISGNLGAGVRIDRSVATGNKIQGNFIGTDAHGTSIIDISGNQNNMGNGDAGVAIYDAADNSIGNSELPSNGFVAGAGNVISGNNSFGIEMSSGNAGPHGNGVGSNFIGTDLTKSMLLGNFGDGIQLCLDSHNNLIGGTTADFANVIANNFGNGVNLLDTAKAGNTVRRNSIYNNQALGIDLGNNGVTANDSVPHTGPNNYQNFPDNLSATASSGTGTISGTLNSAPGDYIIDFYRNVSPPCLRPPCNALPGISACDDSGNGEGEEYLGSKTVTIDSGGTVTFTSDPYPISVDNDLAATATSVATGDTSEFSACLRVTASSNTNPTITAFPVTLSAGSMSNFHIADVDDVESGKNGVTVTVTSSNPSNGVTVSNIVNVNDGTGKITGDLAALCGAGDTTFTLTADDGNGGTATAMLNVTVSPNTAPTLTYAPSYTVSQGNSLSPATGPSDNGSVTSIVVQSAGIFTGKVSVDPVTGVVSVSNTAPTGTDSVTIRATDNCSASTDATFTLTVNTATCTPAPTTGMVSWWDGSGSGTAANDIQGTNSGTLEGNATFAPGKVGQAFDLNGTTGTDVLFTGNNIPIGSNPRTVDMWVKVRNAAHDHEILFYGAGALRRAFGIDVDDTDVAGNVGLQLFTFGDDLQLSSGVPLNQWMHIAVTYDGNLTLNVYVNGELKGTLTLGAPLDTAGSNVRLGHFSPDGYFNGLIDEVEVFNRELSQTEIRAIYNASFAGKCHTSTIQFSAATYSANEADGAKTITVTRTGAHDTAASVDYATSAGPDTLAGRDYKEKSGNLSFAPGEMSETFDVTILQDNSFSNDHTVNLTLSGVTGAGASLGTTNPALLTITDNGDTAPTLSITSAVMHPEGNSSTTDFVFTVTKTGATDLNATVNFATQNGTTNPATGGVTCGTAGVDYETQTGSLSFGPNETTKTITIKVCGDTTVEADETFFVNLSSPGNATSGTGQGVGTIQNDDCPTSFTVNNNGDASDATPGDGLCADANGKCTLRAAIQEANALTTCGTIDINLSGVVSPINLGSVLPDVAHSVKINGPGANLLTVQRNSGSSFRIFTANSSQAISISGLTVSNGSETNGGGILNTGAGVLTLTNSTVSGNTAQVGGGIANVGGTGTVKIVNSTITGNSASNGAGGIFNNNPNTLNLINSTISGNSAAVNGGGVYNQGTTSITNCTITNNRADNDNNGSGAGGGLYRDAGTVTLRNAIVAGNFNDASPSTTIDDVNGSFSSNGHNLIGSRDGSTGLTDDPTCATLCDNVGTNASPRNALLGALMNNGGSTFTHGLLYNSPAVDAGDNCVAQVAHCSDANIPQLTLDQRGSGFSRQADGDLVSGAVVDIGAYERQATETRAVPNGSNVNVDLNDAKLTFPCTPAKSCGGAVAKPDSAQREAADLTPANGGPSVSITTANPNPPAQPTPPTGFVTGNSSNPPLPAFDISTSSVTYDTPVTICFYLPSINDQTFFNGLRVFHREAGQNNIYGDSDDVLVNVTRANNPIDFANRLVCAEVNSFSAFVIGHTITPTATNSTVSGRIVDDHGTSVEGAAVRMSGTQNRLTITDAAGNYHFDDVETNGFYVVSPSRANFTFSPAQRSFSQLGQHTDAVFTATANGGALNPLDTTEYFVRQQYLDFLGREPDEAGFNFWVNNIESCGNDVGCREVKRIDTSAAFFLSIEFQQTGYLIYRTYQAAYGDISNAPVPVRLSEFKPDSQEISNGVVVLQDGWQQKLENNKRAFLAEFVQRARFTSAYPVTMTPAEFVDKLFANASVPLTDADHAAAISEFGTATDSSNVAARARALRRVAENAALTRQEFNQAFVLMEYFGYLRRDPNSGQDADFTGYNFWLDKLNRFNGNFRNAEMVKAFLISIEYRGRFPR